MAGIYVHIPFCRKACTYCDFHFSTNLGRKGDMAASIAAEADLKKDFFPTSDPLDTLYFGGGTPSLLDAAELNLILSRLHQLFTFKPNFEFTFECNPDDLSEDTLQVLRGAGVNRLSIGVQSFREADLELMNRSHSAEQARSSISKARKMGFENLTVDLIYGIPGLSEADWEANVKALVDLGAPHVSAYALTVEERTALYKQVEKGQVQMPDDGIFESQYLKMVQVLEAAGYEHYELSNFALPGQRSRHNSAYWFGEPYLGLGPSAHSYVSGSRSWNVSNNAKYLHLVHAGENPVEEVEELSTKDQANEYLLTRLRLREGIQLADFQTRFGWDVYAVNKMVVEQHVEDGRVVLENGWLRLTPKGLMLSNAIIGGFFAD